MVVDKSAITMRDGEGKLLPMEIESVVFKGSIKITPLTEGDFNELKTNAGNLKDEEMIVKYLKEPVLTKEEAKALPAISKNEIVKCLLMTTGATREDIDKAMKKDKGDTAKN